MKRRIRTQPTNPFYSNEPAVSRNKMADAGLSPNPNLANQPPKIVDKKPGRLSGLAGFQDKHRPKSGGAKITIPKLGTSQKNPPQQGALRASGHPQAHRIGGLKPMKRV